MKIKMIETSHLDITLNATADGIEKYFILK